MRKPKSENPDPVFALGMSVNDLFGALDAALGDGPDKDGDEHWPWVVDVDLDDSTFIYCCYGSYYEQGYSVENGVVSLAGVAPQVQSDLVEAGLYGFADHAFFG